MNTRAELGRLGEDLAVGALSELGWTILARNWRCRHGEIDIVALDGDEAVIVEVKTRRSAACGPPAEAVTAAKLSRLRRLAAAWLAGEKRRFAGVRIDVVAVRIRAGAASIEHLRGVG